MKNKLFNPVFLVLTSIILPIAAFEALVTDNVAASDILFALFCATMALIVVRKIICDTLEIGERVDRLFRSPRFPEIHITQEQLGAA